MQPTCEGDQLNYSKPVLC